MRIYYIFLFLFYFPCIAVFPSNYNVGPGKTYPNLQAVVSLLSAGDTVFVDGNNTYSGDVNFTKNGTFSSKIVVKGVAINGKKPVLSGTTNTVTFNGDHYIFDGLEVTGGSSRGMFHVADDITIRNCVIHDCPNHGLLGADAGSGSLTLEYSEIYNCGEGTQHHSVYMCTDQGSYPGSVFRMQYCYLHDNNGGNMVKTRSERNEIYYNWIEAKNYRELEMIGPDTGPRLFRMDGDVMGNVFVHHTSSPVVRTGGDGGNGNTDGSEGRYRFVNNTFLFENGSGNSVVQVYMRIESIEMHNNVIYRKDGGVAKIINDQGAIWTQGNPIYAGSNNWVMTGTTSIPSQWTGTLTGNTNPGFVNLSANDANLTSGSVLVNAGNTAPLSLPGYPFPNPLFPPAFLPPLHVAITAASARPVNGSIDIGAFEYAIATVVPGFVSDKSELIIYPNPTSETINVLVFDDMTATGSENFQIKIYDVYGTCIGRFVCTFSGNRIPLQSYPAGIYFLEATTKHSILREKIVINR